MSSVRQIEQDKQQGSKLKISDEKLICLYVKGDLQALDELINRYKKPLYSFLWRFASPGIEVEEIFQETWLRVIQKSSNFEQNSFKGWIFKIAYHLVIDRSRLKRSNLSLDYISEYSDGIQTLADTLPAKGGRPDQNANNGDLKKAIEQALNNLPPEQREVFVLRMEVDMPFKEIAELQGTSVNTSLARMQYALSKMRNLLAPLHEGTGEKL